MKTQILILGFLLIAMHFCKAQTFDIENIHISGDNDKRINIVILGDGYQLHELDKFITDADQFSTALLSESPFSEYQNYFNIYAIKVPSNESGADHPGTATDVSEPASPVKNVDTYFNASFDAFNIHRLLVANSYIVTTVLANNFPDFDQAIVLVNSPVYGGSGGFLAVTSTHPASNEIAIHEIGHSFARLADEYYAGDAYAYEQINMTQNTDPSTVKWKNWHGSNDIGIYQHSGIGNASQWYRPHQNCKMRALGNPFCSVCKEATVEKIHNLISPIDSYTPNNSSTISNPTYPLTFLMNIIMPTSNELIGSWRLNGVAIGNDLNTLILNENNLNDGLNTLEYNVHDATVLLRVDGHNAIHNNSVLWTIEKSADDDGDGVTNNEDLCANTPNGEAVDTNGCSQSQLDDDNDSVTNNNDLCANTPNGEAVDTNGCSQSQLDDDNDSVTNNNDLCANTPNGEAVDTNGCSQSQLDDDNDSVTNNNDLCANTPNGESVDADGCSQSQLDDDNDSVTNNNDLCANTPNGEAVDTDGCSQSQLDDDNDSVTNNNDLCANTPNGEAVDTNGCSQSQLDDDNDGVSNSNDNCENTPKDKAVDSQGCIAKFLISPNPVVDKFKTNIEFVGSLKIFNASGSLVKTLTIEVEQNEFDLSFLSSGIYYLRFTGSSDGLVSIFKK